jgi:hypothetical protein
MRTNLVFSTFAAACDYSGAAVRKGRENEPMRVSSWMRMSVAGVCAGIVAGAVQAQEPQVGAAAVAPPSPVKNDYAKDESWLCKPGRKDACAIDLSTTVVEPDGEQTRETWAANPQAPIDCFYVYPTVSADPTPNSDMTAGPEEARVIAAQAARFGSQCRVYAPLYRQVTLTALRAATLGQPMTADRALGYSDVAQAWKHYLDNDNQGRGVVLIGHSQGAGMLTQLMRNEIDGKPVQSKIVSALLIGAGVPVPAGKDVGGAFKNMPLCRSEKQTGCVISYASFRETAPPPATSRFGKVEGEGQIAACTNPAALDGKSGALDAYFTSTPRMADGQLTGAFGWTTPAKPIDTPFVRVPGFLTAECVAKDGRSYLSVRIQKDPADPRTDDIPGDVVANGQVQADWGLHLVDMNLAMGNLLRIVGQQAQAYGAAVRK